jgi:hypothetical protein
MTRLALPVALLAAAVWVLVDWYQGRYAAPPAAAAPVAATVTEWDDTWLRERIGPMPPPPEPARLRVRLRDWGPPDTVTGWESLSASGSAAVRLELERWLRLELPTVLQAELLEIAVVEGGHDLTLRVTGPAAGVLPLFEHLLAMPLSKGYFTDPLRVRVEHDPEHGVVGEIVVRVRPGSEFVAG